MNTNTNTQFSYQPEEENQAPPVRDLVKLTALAACAFTVFIFIGAYILLSILELNLDMLLGRGAGFYLSLLFLLICVPISFAYFLPWMERSSLNELSGNNNILWALLCALFFFLLMALAIFILSQFGFGSSGNDQVLYGKRASAIGALLKELFSTLLTYAVLYACFWCSFTWVNKMRGFEVEPRISEQQQQRARQVTKWSFVLIQSIGITTVIIFSGLFVYLFHKIYRYNFTLSDLMTFGQLSITVGLYVLILFCATALLYGLTEHRLPKSMRQVQPEKLFYCMTLITIFGATISFVSALCGAWLQSNARHMGGGIAIILLIAFLVFAIWMCKRVLVDDIQIPWIRILAVICMFAPSLIFAIIEAKDGLSFFLFLLTIFFITSLVMFLVARFISWSLRIVYGPPDALEL